MLTGGKNRFGPEGEVAWLEMTAGGLREIDPTALLVSGHGEPGAAIALPPADSAFVGEVGLTGLVRGGGAMTNRLAAARAVGVRTIFAPPGGEPMADIAIVPVRHVKDALTWAAGRRA
jgi:predicted ATP-dependent serine protease